MVPFTIPQTLINAKLLMKLNSEEKKQYHHTVTYLLSNEYCFSIFPTNHKD